MPQITNETWDTTWTLVDRVKGKKIHDNYFNKPSVLNYFTNIAGEEKFTGGKEIEIGLEYGATAGTWFNGHDDLPTTEPDIVQAAFVPWAYFATPVVIAFDNEMESRQAAFAEALLEKKMSNAMKSIKNDMDIALQSARTGKACLGIQDTVRSTVTSGTLGGIDLATNTWYRNQAYTTSTDFDAYSAPYYTGYTALNTLWNNCSDGEDMPDMHLTTLTFYAQYENIMNSTGNLRFNDTKAGSKWGIYSGAPAFHGAPVIFNRNAPSGAWYMFNKDALKVATQTGVSFMKTPFQSPHNQLSKICYVVHSIQMLPMNPRRTGVATTLT